MKSIVLRFVSLIGLLYLPLVYGDGSYNIIHDGSLLRDGPASTSHVCALPTRPGRLVSATQKVFQQGDVVIIDDVMSSYLAYNTLERPELKLLKGTVEFIAELTGRQASSCKWEYGGWTCQIDDWICNCDWNSTLPQCTCSVDC
jgi:hypothetical protein